MPERFIKLIPSNEMRHLAKKHPNAFILLTFIAERARRENGDPDGLTIGQCHIGDYKEYGLTEKEYRTAKKVLIERNHIKIIETCRTRKTGKNSISSLISENRENWATKRATRITTIGTLVELCSTTVYDINSETDNHQKGDRKGERGATEGRPKGDEQEYSSSIKDYVDTNKKDSTLAPNDLHRSGAVALQIAFSFEQEKFLHISDDHISGWKEAYPGVDIIQQLKKMREWLLSNPNKAPRKKFRQFITSWLSRNQEKLSNRAEYQANGNRKFASYSKQENLDKMVSEIKFVGDS